MAMNQYLSINLGQNKVTVDLSRVRKHGLKYETKNLGMSSKPKVLVFYDDLPDKPEVTINFDSSSSAEEVYDYIGKKLDEWADHSNNAKIEQLIKERDVLRENINALKEQTSILTKSFEQMKELMQIMDDDVSVSKAEVKKEVEEA